MSEMRFGIESQYKGDIKMKIRMITFGYKIENGKIVVAEEEAAAVKKIFSEYIAGKGLKAIADALNLKKVIYYNGDSVWSKNKVDRILANEKYIGSEGYPPILTTEDFGQAQKIKEKKGFKERKGSPLVRYLERNVICGQCGKLLHRDPLRKTREKWYCTNGCKTEYYISDMQILDGILQIIQKAKQMPLLLREQPESALYEPNPEIIRMSNEIRRMMDSPEPNYAVGKKLILECAAAKFMRCRENKSAAYTDSVLRELAASRDLLSEQFLERIVEKIKLEKSGKVTILFINGTALTSEVVKKNGRKGKKDRNGNTGKSVIIETKE